MAAFNLSPIGNGWQFFGGNTAGSNPNLPLAAGTLRTFAAGTSTPLATYSNNLGSIANAVQIVLDSTGRPPGEIWFPNGVAYKFTLNDSLGNQITSFDNLVGINDSGGVTTTAEWAASNFTPTFSSGTVFTTAGNSTLTFQVGRRIQAQVTAGLVYGSIVTSVFAAGSTTITLVMDSGMALDNGLTSVNVGFLGESNPSIPASIPYPMTFGDLRGTIVLDSNLIHLGAVYFQASRITTNQTVGTTVIFNATSFQSPAFAYSTATGIFTAPFAGIYQFNANVTALNTSGGALNQIATINANAINVAYCEIDNTANNSTTGLNLSTMCFLSAGQTCKVVFPNIAANNAVQFGLSFFNGYMIARTS